MYVDDKTAKVAAVAPDGQFWISKVLSTIEELEKDTKHVTLLSEVDEDEQAVRRKARELIERLHKVRAHPRFQQSVSLTSSGRYQTRRLTRPRALSCYFPRPCCISTASMTRRTTRRKH